MLLLLGLFAALSGCMQSGNFAPVADRYTPPERVPSHYTVVRGDTLYSIAWRYGLDFRKLAAANRVASPYAIYPGQKLVLQEAPIAASPKPSTSVPTTPKPAPSPVPNSVPKSTPAPRPAGQKPTADAGENLSITGWHWPAKGSVVKPFSDRGYVHKGIDIAGKLGEPVYAAAGGVVVYAGNGLVGYGNLLIVKHDDRYLSAYAHNSRLRVREGQTVKFGQHIADIGDTGTDSAKLHFEIRLDGKPVDPQKLLPRRG